MAETHQHGRGGVDGMGPILLIRVDASAEIGAGHASRCLALAQAWHRAGGEAVFAMAEQMEFLDAALREVARVEPLDVVCGSDEDARRTLGLARRHDAAWIVVDGHRFREAFVRDVSQGEPRTMVLDDEASLPSYDVDVILNQNVGASAADYGARTEARLLLGPTYFLLREVFFRWIEFDRPIPQVARKLLVTLGGGVSREALATVLEAVGRARVPGFEATVVGDLELPAARRASPNEGAAQVRFHGMVQDMAEVMASGDLAVCGGGVTSLELAYMRVPSVILTLSEDQARNAVGLDRAGVAMDAGAIEAVDPAVLGATIERLCRDAGRRAEMSARGRVVVDGRGADRLAAMLLEVAGE